MDAHFYENVDFIRRFQQELICSSAGITIIDKELDDTQTLSQTQRNIRSIK